jgi:DNA-binding transcriptional LysR family regulator
LGLLKATVSVAVRELESSLGTRLLHRTTRKVQMTLDGQVYYERCKELLSVVDNLQAMFQQSGESLRGRLRVDMPSGIARSWIGSLRFSGRYSPTEAARRAGILWR